MPTGRPPTLGQIARQLPDGTRLTRAEVVIRGVQIGLDLVDACTAAGIDKGTYRNWAKAGAQAMAKAARGERLGAKERDYVRFLTDVERAKVEFEEICLGLIHRAGDGGLQFTETKTVTRRDRRGEQVIERTETKKVLMPQWQAKAWLLERRRQSGYVKRYEVTGAGGRDLIPEGQRATELADAFEAHLEAEAAAAADERRRELEAAPAFDGS